MKLLIVSFWCPDPPDNGSRLRAYHLIRHLAELGHEIELLALAQEESEIHSAQQNLSKFCSRGVTLFPSRFFKPATVKALAGFFSTKPRHLIDTHQPAFAAAVAQACRSTNHDVVLALELGAAHYVPADTQIPCILDQLEISPFVKAARGAGSSRERFRRGLTLVKQKSHLSALGRRYRLWMTVSEAEAGYVRALVKRAAPAIHVLPNGVDLRTNQADPGMLYHPDRLVYNGALSFSANADAVRWFVEAILPIIQQTRPAVCPSVTGRNDAISSADPLRHTSGVALTGFLEDVRPAIQQSAVCVVPLREGGGTRLKILEAMSLGVPVVSTSRGAEGLDITDGRNIIIADTPAAFAEATVKLINDPDLRQVVGAAGRALVEAHYGWDAIAATLDQILKELAQAKT